MPDGVRRSVRGKLLQNHLRIVLRRWTQASRDIVRLRYYVTRARTFRTRWLPVLAEYLGGIDPAATMIVCQLIRPEILIEIEVTAQVA